MDLLPGRRINRFTLVRPLGEGGQGSVWKVIDPLDGGAVRALKLLLVRDLDEGAAQRARREARALIHATHPALVPCRELFEVPAEALVGLVFDYQRGRSLADLAADPRLTRVHRQTILVQLADALAHVHALGIVHRDIKPANVLITEAFWQAPDHPGGVKLLDFGIAVPVGNPHPMTSVGAMIGTGPYLPPELLLPGVWSIPPEGFQRDGFAFGVLAWDLLKGAHPTGLSPTASLAEYAAVYKQAHQGHVPWPPAGLEEPWRSAIRACLKLDPRARPAHGTALLELLPQTVSSAGHLRRIQSDEPAVVLRATEMHVSAPGAPKSITVSPTTPPRRETELSGPPVPSSRGSVLRRSTSVDASPRGAGTPALRFGWGLLSLGLVMSVAAVAWTGVVDARSLRSWFEGPSDVPQGNPGVPLPMAAASSTAAPTASSAASSLPASLPGDTAQAIGHGVRLVTNNGESGSVPRLEAPKLAPCCAKSKGPCSSGRACDPDPSCPEYLPLESRWWLRIISATRGEHPTVRNIAATQPGSSICLSRWQQPDTEVCAPLKRIVKSGGDRENRLLVTTRDLMAGDLQIRILGPKGQVEFERRTEQTKRLRSTVLCSNLSLRSGATTNAPITVSVVLDDE
ncbi:serine/threonine-protein kinase [Chondromyces crocatus]|uniref:non-specific serine/threonine protein kinase n=1 Tax=Chondromyces crocatus TaxID=52 RepID=A0A0K1EJT8_CHOCO|nr:serine/threonine-protein kinase [Chondromyces crocatus]AKT41120.1 uncharacterized protein CMC5_052810 [Chondromyces crocatus]